MKAVIKFTNGYGEVEYLGSLNSFAKSINQAYIFDEILEASQKIYAVKNSFSAMTLPIWNTAIAVGVEITEVK